MAIQSYEHCEGCPLAGVGIPTDTPGIRYVRFVVVTDTPSQYNASEGRLMSRNASGVFAKHMRSAGFSKEDFVFAPATRCPHDPDAYSTKEKKAIKDHCRPYLSEYIERVGPEAIVPLGAPATSQVLGRPVQISKVRGVCTDSQEHGAKVFPMLSPGQVMMYPQHETTFSADCETLNLLASEGYNLRAVSEQILGEYTFVTDLQFMIDDEPRVLFFDTETTGLEYFKKGTHDVRDYDPSVHGKEFSPSAAVLTMQFCYEDGRAYMLVWDHPEDPIPLGRKRRLRRQLRTLLNNPKTKVVGQNAKYDLTFMAETVGVTYPVSGDTLIMANLLDENSISKGQSMLVKKYVPEMAGYSDQFDSTVDKSRMWEVPLSRLLDYGCGDADSGYLLNRRLLAEIKKDTGLLRHYKYVDIPGLNVLGAIERTGMYVDVTALDAFQEQMESLVSAQYESLILQVPRAVKRAHAEKGLRFSRGDFVRDILFNHREGFRLRPKVFTKTTAKLSADKRVPSVSSKDHLPYFFDECPFTLELAEYVKNERLLNTSVKGFREKYIIDDRVRPTYSQTTAVTGRTASENPNGQNFPKRGPMAKAYRRIFIPPEGFYVLEADLSQAELRISADEANEPTMLRVYRTGGDIHTETALIVMGVPLHTFRLLPKAEQKSARQKAKAVNFGFVYGMGWRKFIVYAKTQYGVEFTDDEAQRIRNAFFRTYSKLSKWHDTYRRMAETEGQVRSYSGRIRHLPMINSEDEMVRAEAGRQAINSPVQNFASDLGLMAMGRLHQEIDPKYLTPVSFVHDAIFCYVAEEYLEWGAKTLKWYMESNPIEEWFGRRLRCPIVADVSFGKNFGDTFEMEGLDYDTPYDFQKFEQVEDGPSIMVPAQRTPPNDGYLVRAD